MACAAISPAPPSDVFEYSGGLPLYPRLGLRPLPPAWGTEASSFAHLARRDLLPNLPLYSGAGTEPPRLGLRPSRRTSGGRRWNREASTR